MIEPGQPYYLDMLTTNGIPEKTLKILVEVIVIRKTSNRIDALITPIQGEGQAWINSERLEVPENN